MALVAHVPHVVKLTNLFEHLARSGQIDDGLGIQVDKLKDEEPDLVRSLLDEIRISLATFNERHQIVQVRVLWDFV